jgi:casein kinase I family protein HRR25
MELINKKYRLLGKIGEGSFGLIYKGENIRTRELVAIKVEPIDHELKLLKNESIIYQFLNNVQGIPSVKWFGKDNKNYYMVLNLLGESLESIKNKKRTFSLSLVLQIGIQIILLLKTIHDKGLLHRDIKPDNFLFGLNNQKKIIHIIDFGFCKSYINNDKHKPIKKTNSLIGSVTYASINAHDCIELSRRDDMETLGYMLSFFYLGELPWQKIITDNSDIVKKMKQQIIENKNLPQILVNYINYVRNLEYEEKPNYFLIIDNFKRELEILKKTN